MKDYHNNYKLPIRNLLIEYYRIKLNPELMFSETLLDALGFRKCSSCYHARVNVDITNNWNNINDLLNTKDEDEDDLPF